MVVAGCVTFMVRFWARDLSLQGTLLSWLTLLSRHQLTGSTVWGPLVGWELAPFSAVQPMTYVSAEGLTAPVFSLATSLFHGLPRAASSQLFRSNDFRLLPGLVSPMPFPSPHPLSKQK